MPTALLYIIIVWNKLSRGKKKKRPCNSVNLPNDLIPVSTTGRYSFPDRIKSSPIKSLTTLWRLIVDYSFF